MIGAIIGDIAGSRFEFDNYRNTDFEIFHRESFFTDDTVCTIAIAEYLMNVLEKGELSHEKVVAKLRKWYLKYPHMSYGTSYLRWIHGYKAGDPESYKPYNSYGNGAAMRISAVGDLFGTKEDVLEMAKFVTEVSHNHPEGIKGAQATAIAQWMARQGSSKEQIRTAIESEFGYNLQFSCDDIRSTYQFNETCQETVPQAIVAFLDSNCFEDAIRLAVSVGGDSDTLAAITGGIAEAYYQQIPEWMLTETKSKLSADVIHSTAKFYNLLNKQDIYPEISHQIVTLF